MSGRLQIRTAAQNDLTLLTDYYLAEADAETASRFVEQARASFKALVQSPGMGSPVPARSKYLAGMRKWRVAGFPKILIFYQEIGDSVRIVRVVHAAADWWALLEVN